MNSAVHQIFTRQFGNLHVTSVRLSLIQRGVFYSLIRIYNNLPQNIQVLIDNVNIFRQTLKNSLISNAFYTIDEFISGKYP
jgi:hypothetical protein